MQATAVGALRRDPLEFLASVELDAGLVRRRVGRRELLIALSPEAVREALVTRQHELIKSNVIDARPFRGVVWKPGLLTSNSLDRHERGRRLLRPSFGRQQTHDHVEPIAREESERLVEAWRRAGEVDVGEGLTELTLQIAARALFGDTVSDADVVTRDIHTVLAAFRVASSTGTMLRDLLHLRSGMRFTAALGRITALSARLMTGPGPLARVLRETELSEDERISEARGVLLAATETTATALTWAIAELAREPALGRLIASEGEDAAERVFTETLRLFPPAWYIGRLAVTDTELVGERVAQGAMVLVSPYLLHRDPRYYSDPTAFDPDRWRTGTVAAARAFTYIPFGAGPRRCIGEEIAWLEGRLVLATLARSLTFELIGRPDLRPSAGASLHPAGRVVARVEARPAVVDVRGA